MYTMPLRFPLRNEGQEAIIQEHLYKLVFFFHNYLHSPQHVVDNFWSWDLAPFNYSAQCTLQNLLLLLFAVVNVL